MNEWQTQLATERLELATRIEKIHSFMGTKAFFELDSLNKWHIQRQHLAMREYCDVLGYRIAALVNNGDNMKAGEQSD